MKNIKVLLLLTFCFLNGSGEEVKDSSSFMELERMVVRAQKGKITGYNVIDSTTILSASEAKSIDGTLADQTGIDLKRTSPSAGKGTGVTIRGLDESRSLILLNGRPLNGAGVMGGDYVDWSLLPLYDVKKIEILRGVKTAE
ncbi:MAG: Plug domain-containing protein [Chitinispirillaceae bacterium]|nr:Plug domain-containing protein [Chitinispirillaceae bacterium]